MDQKYQNIILYCFSGTGNSARACTWIKETAVSHSVNTTIHVIDNMKYPQLPEAAGRSLIGFVYPTHGFLPIWIMFKFMLLFPRSNIKDIFLLTAVGGSTIGKISIPGLAGGAVSVPALVFTLKGYTIAGSASVDLPSSWTALHPPIDTEGIASFFYWGKPGVEQFSKEILTGTGKGEPAFRLSSVLCLPIGMVYLLIGKMFLAKSLFASSHCTGCGKCMRNCPVSAIKMIHSMPYWTWSCDYCMRCFNNCPQTAIQTNLVFQLFMFWLSTVYPLFTLFPLLLPFFVEPMGALSGRIILSVLWYIGYVLLLAGMYRLMFTLLLFKPFNILFTRTSFTNYYGRYKGPAHKN